MEAALERAEERSLPVFNLAQWYPAPVPPCQTYVSSFPPVGYLRLAEQAFIFKGLFASVVIFCPLVLTFKDEHVEAQTQKKLGKACKSLSRMGKLSRGTKKGGPAGHQMWELLSPQLRLLHVVRIRTFSS